ncbi:hypothetical protein PGT21_026451 [Puccinia graminis f. sp. tritici]|uniref:Uncharacterized protein n=1 Tax=Puccinia graminis f. sp. tritici TaxID=56615 RepID=A0A5B0S3B5_PUCGR|nr:hypothetical protein PGT21_026451 [Puccinia graminis f. sp. tritici]KAA1084959.1 hypothetical protein PGTUg99_000796 [Puccinia graminis f. sp. tritici]KAA1090328.1 hypothetical protein PGTUg99_006006 [Puccinia graminis f. sp. tritici]KAA1132636.1 hypothetical protein PGTUg99_017644 [Puccinia graminis f. sp. tritici]
MILYLCHTLIDCTSICAIDRWIPFSYPTSSFERVNIDSSLVHSLIDCFFLSAIETDGHSSCYSRSGSFSILRSKPPAFQVNVRIPFLSISFYEGVDINPLWARDCSLKRSQFDRLNFDFRDQNSKTTKLDQACRQRLPNSPILRRDLSFLTRSSIHIPTSTPFLLSTV